MLLEYLNKDIPKSYFPSAANQSGLLKSDLSRMPLSNKTEGSNKWLTMEENKGHFYFRHEKEIKIKIM